MFIFREQALQTPLDGAWGNRQGRSGGCFPRIRHGGRGRGEGGGGGHIKEGDLKQRNYHGYNSTYMHINILFWFRGRGLCNRLVRFVKKKRIMKKKSTALGVKLRTRT